MNLAKEIKDFQVSFKEINVNDLTMYYQLNVEDCSAVVYKIEPDSLGSDLDKLIEATKVSRITIPNGKMQEIIEKYKYFYEYEGKFYFPSDTLEKSFLKGFQVGTEPSLWKTLLIGRCLSEEGFVYMSVKKDVHNGIRIIQSMTVIPLDNIESPMQPLTETIAAKYNGLQSVSSSNAALEAEISVGRSKYGWNQVVFIEDNMLGRESIIIKTGWRKDKAVLVSDSFSTLATKDLDTEPVLRKAYAMVDENYGAFVLPDLTNEQLLLAVKPIIGKRRYASMKKMPGNALELLLETYQSGTVSERIQKKISKYTRKGAVA